MVDRTRTKQDEGYDYNDFVLQAFTNVEVFYTVGTQADTAIPPGTPTTLAGAWPLVSTIPAEAQLTTLRATQNCLIRFVPLRLLQSALLGILPVQVYLAANTLFTTRMKWVRLYVVRDTLNGTLRIEAEG